MDESCPFICVEHALDDERHSVGPRSAHEIVAYPYTNASAAPGISIDGRGLSADRCLDAETARQRNQRLEVGDDGRVTLVEEFGKKL